MTLEDRLNDRLPGVLRPIEPRYTEEPRGRYTSTATLLASPRTTREVAAIVEACVETRTPIIAYGGGTGLVGGQITPEAAPLVLSLERMTAIRAIHPAENAMVVEAGAILSDVQDAARAAGRLFPLTLASQGSARIGGLLATNAGGVNVLRYGNARDLCLGLEAVLPDGSIWHGLKRLRKDNAGYDLRNLLIGSEGTLGIITAATLALAPIPAGQGTALIHVPSPEAALSLLALARDQVGDCVSAFELISGQGFHFLAETLPDLRQPFATPPAWSVLVDLGLPRGLSPEAALTDIYTAAEAAGLATDGVIAQSARERDDLWNLREHLPEANRRIGAISSHDISLPLSEIPPFIPRATQALARVGDYRINCFGHLGDGNLHFNLFPQPGRSRADHEAERPAIKRTVHDIVHDLGGSVAAEHGVGRLKVEDLERYADPAFLSAMRAVKSALDPHGLMNPGAMLGP
ncbi:MAG: FAD-binding oxidoreductase [Shimia sp.]